MRPTIDYIKEKFDYYNQLCFDGKLPTPPISLNTRNCTMGITKAKQLINRDGSCHYSDIRIEISIRKDLPEVEYIDTLIHEMIHYYIFVNDIVDDSLHGSFFKSKMNDINNRFGIRVTISFDPTDEELVNTQSRVRYVCVVEFEDSTMGLAVVARNKLFDLWDLKKYINDLKDVKWFVSDRAIFKRYPVTVSPKLYIVDSDKIHHYLTGSVELINTGDCIKRKE